MKYGVAVVFGTNLLPDEGNHTYSKFSKILFLKIMNIS